MPDPTKKYPTYKALAEAFRTGELDRTKYTLMVDNDNCHLIRNDVDDDESDDWFEGYGYSDLKEAIAAAGIPCESV